MQNVVVHVNGNRNTCKLQSLLEDVHTRCPALDQTSSPCKQQAKVHAKRSHKKIRTKNFIK